MSSSHESEGNQNTNAQVGPSKDSRKSSTVTSTSFQGSHHVSVEVSDDNSPPLAETSPPDFAELQKIGARYSEDPAAGRQWLVSFGFLKEDTDVSVRLRSKSLSNTEAPYSLFPVLAGWITLWYGIAVEKRKADRSSRSPPSSHDFDWLLLYIADYIDLGHDAFDESETHQICAAITNICKATTQSTDLDGSITILHRLILHNALPRTGLSGALYILCASTVVMKDPLPAISASVKLILSGPMSAQALNDLYEFSSTPTVQNNSRDIAQGRGAIRQLSDSIDLIDDAENMVVDIDRFLNVLHTASKSCIYRYCTEVLKAFHSILDSLRANEVTEHHFDRMMDTIDTCIRTLLPVTTSTRGALSAQSPDRHEVAETEKNVQKHLADRHQTLKFLFADFEQQWNNLNSSQHRRVSDLFMDHAKDLTDSQALLIVSHLPPLGTDRARGADWGQRTTKIFDAFVRNSRISGQSRIIAIQYCAAAAIYIVSSAHDSLAETTGVLTTAGNNIVDRLLNVLGNERDTSVVEQILLSLGQAAFAVNYAGEYVYGELIIRKLLWLVKNERDGGSDVESEHPVLLTCTIRDIFMRGLTMGASTVAVAFEALLDIARPTTKSRQCRLSALRLLVRLRCDAAGLVYIQTESDSQYIAVALCRTDNAMESFTADMSGQRNSGINLNANYFASSNHIWSYPKESSYTEQWLSSVSPHVLVKGSMPDIPTNMVELKMSDWLVKAIEIFQTDHEWEVISFMLVHLGSQLFNTKLFATSLETIVKLRQILCEQVINATFREPPAPTGLKKSDAALCMFNLLTALIPYATMKSESIQKGFGDDLVRSFLNGISGAFEGTARGCIHALCVCSFEIPDSVASQYPNIITKMSKNMTQSHLTIHILEFLAQVARLPEVHSNFTQDEITMIFSICLQFLEKAREHQASGSAHSPRSGTPARHSGLSLRRPPYRAAILQDLGLPQYASALAYHTLIFWFLSLKLEFRAKYISWIVPRLIWKDRHGEETIDEQSQVFIDFMQRTAYSDLGETKPYPHFASEEDGTISTSSWLVGLSILTAQSAGHTGMTQIMKRQASGTTHAVYKQLTAPLPRHHVPSQTGIRGEDSRFGATSLLPPHILLQMVTTAAPTSIADQPIPLPQDDYVVRALNVFDRIPTVDSHKLGVLYVDKNQIKEVEFLANTTASEDYHKFLAGLGYVVSLKPPLEFNPQGLQYPRDGETTLAWRDRVTEIVYHVPTMMPNNLTDDPFSNTKKSHVGNCYVVIVFNESGQPWKMENFPSAVTLVHVVITPANRATQSTLYSKDRLCDKETSDTAHNSFYNVHVLTKENHPNVTSASDPKVISSEMLPGFVRMSALSASVFSQAKIANDNDDNEFPSSWRTRLQQIKMLKQRVSEKTGYHHYHHHHHTGSNIPLSTIALNASGGRRTPVSREEAQEADRDTDEDGALAVQLDFGKWTL